MIKVTGLKLPLGFREEDLRRAAAKKLKLPESALLQVTLSKKSVDARRKSDVHFVCAAEVRIDGDEEKLLSRRRDSSIQKSQPYCYEMPNCGKLSQRPVVIGFGPAGMFAALLLAQCGQRPIVLERGLPVEERERSVRRFWEERVLDPQSNVQFGEGGAGTFSDGKLTTGTGDGRIRKVLEELVKAGAPEEILHRQKPHIGTDRLRAVVQRIREEILRLGGEVWFETSLREVELEGGRLRRVCLDGGELPAQALILATGHSARDTFQMLLEKGLALEPKPFSVGVRVEHLQREIDRGLYGQLAGHPALPVGEYQLSHRVGERGVYTFCMCPGGFVVPAASEAGRVVTNGMSCYARDQENANAALVVSVAPEQYGRRPLDGIQFQRTLEEAAFQAGGGGYRAPAQDVGNFLEGRKGLRLGRVKPSYALGVTGCDLGALFPQDITEMLQLGLRVFNRKLPGFAAADGVLTGVETRTSSPVRILRGEDFQAVGAAGIYPCAEGAGYAGGIMSAAVDGLRVALALMSAYGPPKG